MTYVSGIWFNGCLSFVEEGEQSEKEAHRIELKKKDIFFGAKTAKITDLDTHLH